MPVKLELESEAVLYHAKLYPIPQSREETTHENCDRLCNIGVLKKCNDSKWGTIPKKNGTVHFISDFQELNKQFKSKTISTSKNSRSHAKAQVLSVCDVFRPQYGILPY